MKNAHLILAFLVAASFFPQAPAHAAAVTLSVPTQYSTIQAALDAAETLLLNNPGNSYTVLVEPGTYPGGIALKNNIPLRGRETARTIISGGGSGTLITANGIRGVSVRNFTLRNASIGIHSAGNASISISNNVFSVGTAGTGVLVQGSPATEVSNNSFLRNGVAVLRDAGSGTAVKIANNIFSENQVNISQEFLDETNILYNDFHPAPTGSEPVGANAIPNALVTNPDPRFVAPSAAGALDLHLLAASPCIDTGDPSINDPFPIPPSAINPSDMGAYGGPYADTVPFPVSGVASSVTSTAPYAISLSWAANSAYTVAGYRVHYGTASGAYTGTDAAEGPSPIEIVGSATTSTVLSALSPTSTTPAAPVLAVPEPRDQGLALSWSAVPGATSYRVHWGTLSTSENMLDVGNRTTYTLAGLSNLQTYLVAVSAISQATYYIAVTSYDVSGLTRAPGVSHESAYSAQQTVQVGPTQTSGLSNEVSGIPEAIIGYPDLPNTGCFIATAAYGSRNAGPVRVLRAFRDRWLETNRPGRTLVQWYYRASPDLAQALNEHPRWKPAVRTALGPIVLVAAVLVHAPWAAIVAPLALWALIRNRRTGRRTA